MFLSVSDGILILTGIIFGLFLKTRKAVYLLVFKKSVFLKPLLTNLEEDSVINY